MPCSGHKEMCFDFPIANRLIESNDNRLMIFRIHIENSAFKWAAAYGSNQLLRIGGNNFYSHSLLSKHWYSPCGPFKLLRDFHTDYLFTLDQRSRSVLSVWSAIRTFRPGSPKLPDCR